ncbi:MAG: hypothetical protein QM756_27990 [Polyangiaceae bacterium]
MVYGWFRLGVVSVLLVACSGGSNGPSTVDAEPTLRLEQPKTLLGDGALGLSYFPDQGVSRLPAASGERLLVTAGVSTFLVEGAALESLSQASEVLPRGEPGSFDNGYAGISAVVRVGELFYGFYHAEDQEELPALGGGVPGYYASIGLATSADGASWTKQGAVLTSSHAKSWQAYPNQGDRGAAEPGATLSADGRFVYLYYTEHSRADGRSVDICVARADLESGPPLPGSFFKYRDGAFSAPGIGGRDSPVVVGPNPVVANALQGHVTYVASALRYLMIFGVDAWEERMSGRAPALSGLYAAWSRDGIAFSEPRRLIVDQAVPETGRGLSWEATALLDDEAARGGWLVYGYTPSWGTSPHYMVARRFTLD